MSEIYLIAESVYAVSNAIHLQSNTCTHPEFGSTLSDLISGRLFEET